MTSREAFDAWKTEQTHVLDRLGNYIGTPSEIWQAAIEWASKQAHEAIEEIDDGEAPEYRACQEVIREALK